MPENERMKLMPRKLMMISVFALMATTSANAQLRSGIDRSYDKFKDVTTVTGIRLFDHFTGPASSMGIGVTFDVRGNKLSEPVMVMLTFLSLLDVSNGSDNEWWVIADGERISLGSIIARSTPTLRSGRVTIEQHVAAVGVSPQILRKLANAKKLEMRVGSFRIEEGMGNLWDDLQKAMSLYRDIVKMIDDEKST